MDIDDVMAAYSRERDYYERVSSLCAYQCRSLLASHGIRALVTNRSKDPVSLERKLRQRLTDGNCGNVEEIRRSIVDLAGVRIAMYFPGDLVEVKKLIEDNFQVKGHKQFPDDPRPGEPAFGYSAVHYHVRLRPGSPGDPEARYSDALVEIQIASVLMHAWAEVEHDLMYKPSTGQLSSDEREILSQLNALVIAGETALNHLQRAMERRIRTMETQFKNHYDMAAYLYDELKGTAAHAAREPQMGRVDVLFEFLRLAKLDSSKCLSKFVDGFEAGPNANTVAQQIVDRILKCDCIENAFALYKKAQSIVERRVLSDDSTQVPQKAGEYALLWATLERRLREWMLERGDDAVTRRVSVGAALRKLAEVNAVIAEKLEYAWKIRNHVVHGIEPPEPDQLDHVISTVKEALAFFDDYVDDTT